MYDFDPVAIGEGHVGVLTARHNVAIDRHGNARAIHTELVEQRRERDIALDLARFTIDIDFHRSLDSRRYVVPSLAHAGLRQIGGLWSRGAVYLTSDVRFG